MGITRLNPNSLRARWLNAGTRAKALRQLRKAAAPRLLRLARRRLRHAAVMRGLRIESEKQLDRYIARWASKLLIVEPVQGKVRVRHLTPNELRTSTSR